MPRIVQAPPRSAQTDSAAAGARQRPPVARLLVARGQQLVGRVADLLQRQPVRPYHVHRGVPYARRPAPCRASRPAGARRRRTAARPTSERTMLWQKASARTVAVMIPSVGRAPSSSCWSVRMVVAPSRFLQYAAKSCSPSSRRGGLVHGVHVERPVVPQHVTAQQRVDAAGVVGHAVRVAPPDGREARVEALGRLGAPSRPVRRAASRPASRSQQLLVVLGPHLLGQVDVRDLPAGVHARVGPPGHGQLVRLATTASRSAGRPRSRPARSAARRPAWPSRRSPCRRRQVQPHPDDARAPPRHSRDRSSQSHRRTRERARPAKGRARSRSRSAA